MGCRTGVARLEKLEAGVERLQYQALKKASAAVQGSSMDKVDKIAG